ncbi:hypothetical protein ACFPAF_19925 [Hymenobacter endophyticus]|uniref:DUF4890 domain-containing protein n=1 Tax=Hymenobacter endophyticus TaxID=3076335 RepID=A0ABU3TMR5_9BACT|nr:hypothetical protein [Hymenobacter endophyticus]MDU0372681.1 hypothetical protein [Hymenobacter endophyticus]
MKTLLLAALLTISGTSAALAQTTASHPRPATKPAASSAATQVRPTAPAAPALNEQQIATRANALTDNMQKALGLTPQQLEKVRQINLVSVRGVESARQKYARNVRKMAGVVDDIGQSRLEMLKETLTPAQFDKYQRKREEKMGVPSSQGVQGNAVPGLPGGE